MDIQNINEAVYSSTQSSVLKALANEKTEGAIIIGDVEKVPRTIGFFEIVSVAFNLLSSWLAVATTLILGVSHGGSVAVLYGLLVILMVYGAVALSLAELAARYPTAAGQYHWTALLAPESMRRGLSYSCGSINVIGRIAMTSTADIVVAQLAIAVLAFNIPSYSIKGWHLFIAYQISNLLSLVYNLFVTKKAPWTHNIGFVVSLSSLFVISITCLATTPNKQSSYHVWRQFINQTGWNSDALVFLLGLINPTYGFGGLDGAIHLAEDCFQPARTVPRAILTSLVVGFITAFFFAISMFYCVKDIHSAITSRTGLPIYEIWFQATESGAAATTFAVATMIAAFFAAIGSVQTSSRLTWSFARDEAMILSKYLKLSDDKLGVPIWALLFNAFWLTVIGCIQLLSSAAFNMFIQTAMLAEVVSFSFPAALLMWQGRNSKYLPTKSAFNLGKSGWLVNSLVIGWTAFALVVWSFPVTRPVLPGSMNYTSVIFGLYIILSMFNWLFYARKHYQGPNVTLLVGH